MANEKIKQIMKQCNVATWQVADLLGVSEQTVFRKFRHEMTDTEQENVIALIKENYEKRAVHNND